MLVEKIFNDFVSTKTFKCLPLHRQRYLMSFYDRNKRMPFKTFKNELEKVITALKLGKY